ncbi:hypothetical protein TCAL_01142, partial [Tigriopus californicus]|eukprot:TCALIF_01142-PA protein Name:"Protein of unknown function" AED:0.72 eAED:0.72 QI:269/0.2/0.16/0.5/0.6/0.5/6/0/2662
MDTRKIIDTGGGERRRREGQGGDGRSDGDREEGRREDGGNVSGKAQSNPAVHDEGAIHSVPLLLHQNNHNHPHDGVGNNRSNYEQQQEQQQQQQQQHALHDSSSLSMVSESAVEFMTNWLTNYEDHHESQHQLTGPRSSSSSHEDQTHGCFESVCLGELTTSDLAKAVATESMAAAGVESLPITTEVNNMHFQHHHLSFNKTTNPLPLHRTASLDLNQTMNDALAEFVGSADPTTNMSQHHHHHHHHHHLEQLQMTGITPMVADNGLNGLVSSVHGTSATMGFHTDNLNVPSALSSSKEIRNSSSGNSLETHSVGIPDEMSSFKTLLPSSSRIQVVSATTATTTTSAEGTTTKASEPSLDLSDETANNAHNRHAGAPGREVDLVQHAISSCFSQQETTPFGLTVGNSMSANMGQTQPHLQSMPLGSSVDTNANVMDPNAFMSIPNHPMEPHPGSEPRLLLQNGNQTIPVDYNDQIVFSTQTQPSEVILGENGFLLSIKDLKAYQQQQHQQQLGPSLGRHFGALPQSSFHQVLPSSGILTTTSQTSSRPSVFPSHMFSDQGILGKQTSPTTTPVSPKTNERERKRRSSKKQNRQRQQQSGTTPSSSARTSSPSPPESVIPSIASIASTLSENDSFSPAAVDVLDFDQFELAQLVEDVGYMVNEQEKRSPWVPTSSGSSPKIPTFVPQEKDEAALDVIKTQALIYRNLPSKSELLSNYRTKDTQSIADELARSVVERALEHDKKKLFRRKLDNEPMNVKDESHVANRFVEVAVNRMLDVTVNTLMEEFINDLASLAVHGCENDLSQVSNTMVVGEDLLQTELSDFLREVGVPAGDTSQGLHRNFRGLFSRHGTEGSSLASAVNYRLSTEGRPCPPQPTHNPNHVCTTRCKETIRKQKDLAVQINLESQANGKKARLDERRKRNELGLLLSSLREKVYHCRCTDCQAERAAKGEPEPSDPIELRPLELPGELDANQIPIPKKKGRGRPRLYPRIEDLWKRSGDGGNDAIENLKPQEDPTLDKDGLMSHTKRRLGRPRKMPLLPPSPKPTDSSDLDQAADYRSAVVRKNDQGKLVLTIKTKKSPEVITDSHDLMNVTSSKNTPQTELQLLMDDNFDAAATNGSTVDPHEEPHLASTTKKSSLKRVNDRDSKKRRREARGRDHSQSRTKKSKDKDLRRRDRRRASQLESQSEDMTNRSVVLPPLASSSTSQMGDAGISVGKESNESLVPSTSVDTRSANHIGNMECQSPWDANVCSPSLSLYSEPFHLDHNNPVGGFVNGGHTESSPCDEKEEDLECRSLSDRTGAEGQIPCPTMDPTNDESGNSQGLRTLARTKNNNNKAVEEKNMHPTEKCSSGQKDEALRSSSPSFISGPSVLASNLTNLPYSVPSNLEIRSNAGVNKGHDDELTGFALMQRILRESDARGQNKFLKEQLPQMKGATQQMHDHHQATEKLSNRWLDPETDNAQEHEPVEMEAMPDAEHSPEEAFSAPKYLTTPTFDETMAEVSDRYSHDCEGLFVVPFTPDMKIQQTPDSGCGSDEEQHYPRGGEILDHHHQRLNSHRQKYPIESGNKVDSFALTENEDKEFYSHSRVTSATSAGVTTAAVVVTFSESQSEVSNKSDKTDSMYQVPEKSMPSTTASAKSWDLDVHASYGIIGCYAESGKTVTNSPRSRSVERQPERDPPHVYWASSSTRADTPTSNDESLWAGTPQESLQSVIQERLNTINDGNDPSEAEREEKNMNELNEETNGNQREDPNDNHDSCTAVRAEELEQDQRREGDVKEHKQDSESYVINGAQDGSDRLGSSPPRSQQQEGTINFEIDDVHSTYDEGEALRRGKIASSRGPRENSSFEKCQGNSSHSNFLAHTMELNGTERENSPSNRHVSRLDSSGLPELPSQLSQTKNSSVLRIDCQYAKGNDVDNTDNVDDDDDSHYDSHNPFHSNSVSLVSLNPTSCESQEGRRNAISKGLVKSAEERKKIASILVAVERKSDPEENSTTLPKYQGSSSSSFIERFGGQTLRQQTQSHGTPRCGLPRLLGSMEQVETDRKTEETDVLRSATRHSGMEMSDSQSSSSYSSSLSSENYPSAAELIQKRRNVKGFTGRRLSWWRKKMERRRWRANGKNPPKDHDDDDDDDVQDDDDNGDDDDRNGGGEKSQDNNDKRITDSVTFPLSSRNVMKRRENMGGIFLHQSKLSKLDVVTSRGGRALSPSISSASFSYMNDQINEMGNGTRSPLSLLAVSKTGNNGNRKGSLSSSSLVSCQGIGDLAISSRSSESSVPILMKQKVAQAHFQSQDNGSRVSWNGLLNGPEPPLDGKEKGSKRNTITTTTSSTSTSPSTTTTTMMMKKKEKSEITQRVLLRLPLLPQNGQSQDVQISEKQQPTSVRLTLELKWKNQQQDGSGSWRMKKTRKKKKKNRNKTKPVQAIIHGFPNSGPTRKKSHGSHHSFPVLKPCVVRLERIPQDWEHRVRSERDGPMRHEVAWGQNFLSEPKSLQEVGDNRSQTSGHEEDSKFRQGTPTQSLSPPPPPSPPSPRQTRVDGSSMFKSDKLRVWNKRREEINSAPTISLPGTKNERATEKLDMSRKIDDGGTRRGHPRVTGAEERGNGIAHQQQCPVRKRKRPPHATGCDPKINSPARNNSVSDPFQLQDEVVSEHFLNSGLSNPSSASAIPFR